MRIIQTYDEMQQFVERAAYYVLAPEREDMDALGEELAVGLSKRIAEDAMMHVDAEDEGVERTQWRIMWTNATGDENGARWHDEPPSTALLREWCEDFQPAALRVERRTVIEYPPVRDTSFDLVVASDKEDSR